MTDGRYRGGGELRAAGEAVHPDVPGRCAARLGTLLVDQAMSAVLARQLVLLDLEARDLRPVEAQVGVLQELRVGERCPLRHVRVVQDQAVVELRPVELQLAGEDGLEVGDRVPLRPLEVGLPQELGVVERRLAEARAIGEAEADPLEDAEAPEHRVGE